MTCIHATLGFLERHQVAVYLLGLLIGGAVGLAFPAVSAPATSMINPVLAALLYATFLGIPFARIGQSLKDWRFLTTAMALNFLVVPAVVYVLSRIVAQDRVVLVGVLFVLLTPCIDYVIVFSGLAGGAKDRLLAAAPLLMLAQMGLLPVFLWLFVGSDLAASIAFGPFVEAFVWIIALPLALAGLTQWAATRSRWASRFDTAVAGAMVPLMALTLAVVVASQIAGVRDQVTSLLAAAAVYILFAVVMVPVGAFAGRLAGLDVPGRRSIVFSGVTRNSLVILPLVLALPPAYALAPLVVVTQTLVELIVMITLVRAVPQLVRRRPPQTGRRTTTGATSAVPGLPGPNHTEPDESRDAQHDS